MEIENEFQIASGAASSSPEAMLEALVKAGHSNTRARRAVITALCETGDQVSPASLLALGRAHHPALGIVTVYRTLDILLELELVRKLHSDEGCHRYAPSTHHHGHHVICQQCQRAIEFEGCDLEAVVGAVEAATGFQVRSHFLELFGVCPDCQAKASS
jgi:Fur family transcriptional regulator, ferric uptake regulator